MQFALVTHGRSFNGVYFQVECCVCVRVYTAVRFIVFTSRVGWGRFREAVIWKSLGLHCHTGCQACDMHTVAYILKTQAIKKK